MTHVQPLASGLSRPVSRRSMLAFIGASAAVAVAARVVSPHESTPDAASTTPSGAQPPPAYDGIVGLL